MLQLYTTRTAFYKFCGDAPCYITMEWGLGRRPTTQNPVGQLADRWVLQKKKGTHMSACFLI